MKARPASRVPRSGFDPLELTVMANAFAMIAEEMGTVMIRGALSPNIRERRDLSAALFDGDGRMVAQAAHIPVHLGAMPESVAAVRKLKPRAGDVFLLNDPFAGGSHLPDLTTIEAIGVKGKVVGYTAIRAHHADVGGMAPGSMPQGATELVQEGLVLPPVRLVKEGELDDELMRLFATGALQWAMGRFDEDEAIEAKMVTKAIERAQTTVEQKNAEIRKNVLKYDEVMNEQRKVIYKRRDQILDGEDLKTAAMEYLAAQAGKAGGVRRAA